MNHDDQSYHDSKVPSGDTKRDSSGSESGVSEISSRNSIAPNLHRSAQKLVTALYMVTDCLEDDEPLKKKLRTLGVELLSEVRLLACPPELGRWRASTNRGDSRLAVTEITHMISGILSFLDIALKVRLVSQMNFSILKEEFENLEQQMNEKLKSTNILFPEEFFKENGVGLPGESGKNSLDSGEQASRLPASIEDTLTDTAAPDSKRHSQKQNVLYKKIEHTSLRRSSGYNLHSSGSTEVTTRSALAGGFVKIEGPERKNKILKFIKQKKETCPEGAKRFEGVTITDISMVVNNCSQKTIQRDIVSLIKEGVLKKTGEKRWSKYLLT